jgi:hypothetical protein
MSGRWQHTVAVEDLEEHRRVLRELTSAGGDVSTLAGQLRQFRGFDVEPLISLGASDVINVLERFLTGQMSVDEVGIWAEALEVRDDIDFGEDGVISRAVFDLASEGLGVRPITRLLAEKMISDLRELPA